MAHVAIDLALGTSGVAWPGGYDAFCCPNLTGTRRLRWWATTLQRFYRTAVDDHQVDTVIVGAPFIHPQHPSGAVSTIKLHGVAEFLAGNLGLRYVEVQDTMVRPAVIGKGAKKPDVLPWARSIGCELTDDDGDIADAVLFWTFWADRELNRGDSAPVISDTVTKAVGA